MRILIVGGTGLVGAHAALHLLEEGHEVVLASRNAPAQGTPLARIPFVRCNYIEDASPDILTEGFDALVFAAGNDIRHVGDGDLEAHWQRANVEAVPRFFDRAREAGIGCAINIGSFYPQVRASLIDENPYIRSRHLADTGLRALSRPGFRALSLNAPFIVGSVPGLTVPMFDTYTRYALGELDIPRFAPKGGVNFISTRSLSEAISGALALGEGGKAYLLGDENLSLQAYFELFFKAAGDNAPLPVTGEDHPLLPDAAMYWGAGTNFFYEPDSAEVQLLGYRRGDVAAAVQELVERFRSTHTVRD